MKVEQIGENSGIVWRYLSGLKRSVTWNEMQRATKLNPRNLAAAIGWLARENKIKISTQETVETFELIDN